MAVSQLTEDPIFAPPPEDLSVEARYRIANLPRTPNLQSQPQTAEEAFPLPTADEAFPTIPRDLYYNPYAQTPATPAPVGSKPIHEYFKTGFEEGYGSQPYFMDRPAIPGDPNSTPKKYLQRSGLLRDVEEKQKYWLDTFNEALFLGVPAGAEAALRAVQGLVYGTSNAEVQYGIPRDLTLAAAYEAFPAGHMTGFPSRIATPRYAAPLNLDDAAKLGVLGEAPSATEVARQAFEPRTSDVQPAGIPIEATDTTPRIESSGGPLSFERTGEGEGTVYNPREDIHLVARTLAPDLFREYDDLVDQKNTFDRELDELRTKLPHEATAPTEMEFVRGFRAKIVKRMTELGPQVTEAYREANRLMPVDEADAARTKEIVDPAVAHATGELAPPKPPTPTPPTVITGQQLRDQYTKVAPPEGVGLVRGGDTYHDVEGAVTDIGQKAQQTLDSGGQVIMHVEGKERPVVSVRDNGLIDQNGNRWGVGAFMMSPKDSIEFRPAGLTEAVAARSAEEALASSDKLRTEPDDANPGQWVAKDGDQVVGKAASPEGAITDAANRNYEPYKPGATEAPPVTVLGPGETIASRISDQLEATGQPRVVARASGALAEAYYRTRAARFEGRLGTAEQIYEREGLEIRKGTPEEEATYPKAKALHNWFTNTIALFDKSDASSFIHEQGHSWLVNLLDDAIREDAPAELRADAEKVKEWLKVRGDTPTELQHEKFARSIERYIMEGQSPTPGLIKVFEQFKQWMTDIYRTVGRLRAPINDNIRDLFDRLIAEPNRDPVIAPEREGAIPFDEEAKLAAKDTPANEASGKADDIADTRDRAGERLSEDINARRRDARRSPERVSVPREREAAAGDQPGGPGAATADERISQGRTPAETESQTPQRSGDLFEQNATQYLDKAGNIRIENLDVAEDVAQAIRDAAERANGFEDARRGVMPDAETNALADELGMTPSKLNRWKIGQAFNAEQIIAARNLLRNTATVVRDTAAKVASGGGLKELAEYAEARERNILVQRVVAGITAEAGRSLRALRTMASIKDDILLSDYLQQTLNLTQEELKREADRISRLQDPGRINKAIRDLHDPTWQDMVIEAYVNSLLSGPFTIITNAIGNLGPVLTSPVTTGAAATISAIVDPIRGRPRAVTFGEVNDRIYGIYSGAIRGASIFGNIIKDETVGFKGMTKVEQRRFRAIPDINVFGLNIPAGQIVRSPSRVLMATDEFFKAIAFDQELAVQARRQARGEGITEGGDAFNARVADIMNDPSPGIVALAAQHAAYQTFTNQLGPTGRGIQQAINNNLALKVLIPFVRTPTNLFKYSVEHTPLGFATKAMRDDLAGRNGEAAVYQGWGKMATGTMVSLAVAGLAMEGLITGAEPTDPGERETYRLAGYQGYSWKIGGSWYSYRRFDPIGTIVGLVADFVQISKYAVTNEDEHSKLATMITTAISNNVSDKLSMRGLTNAVQAMVDSTRYGESFINQTVGGFLPFGGFVGQWARMEDPLMRDTRSFADSLMARVPSKISIPFTNVSLPMPWPGRETLFPRRDRWGEPIPQEELGPIAVLRSNPTYIDTVMEKLGENKAQPPRKIENVDLTQQQYDDYVRLEGRMSKMMLDSMITPQLVASMPPGMLKLFISNTINSARQMAQKQVMFSALGSDNDIVAKAMKLHLDRLKPAPEARP